MNILELIIRDFFQKENPQTEKEETKLFNFEKLLHRILTQRNI